MQAPFGAKYQICIFYHIFSKKSSPAETNFRGKFDFHVFIHKTLEKITVMCYNVYIMKKYCFLIVSAAAVLASMLLSGCQRDRTTTVIYTDVPSPLTQMTFSESLPPETYSEYMATYTSETETSSGGHYFSMRFGSGIYADTGITAPPADTNIGIDTIKHDAAAVTTVPETENTDSSDEIITCAPNVSETDITDSSETTETAETTSAFTLARPKADTGVQAKATKVSADTSHTRLTSETDTSAESETSE